MSTEVITVSSRQWWWSKRCKYNKGLIVSGFIAFLLYCILGPIFIEPHEEFEETILEMAFQGVLYLFMMGLANLCYTSGSLVDVALNKNNSQKFRERLFAIGYWFSFSLPILFILSIMVRFLIWGQ